MGDLQILEEQRAMLGNGTPLRDFLFTAAFLSLSRLELWCHFSAAKVSCNLVEKDNVAASAVAVQHSAVTVILSACVAIRRRLFYRADFAKVFIYKAMASFFFLFIYQTIWGIEMKLMNI